MPIMNNQITVKNLVKRYGACYALNNVNLDIAKGEVVVIIGPSGGGKSTFLRILMQLEKIDAGEIHIEQVCVARTNNFGRVEYIDKNIWRQVKQKIGIVFQNFPLFPNKTVLENLVLAPLLLKKSSKKEAIIEAQNLLKKIGMGEKSNSYPCELSGGQKQRAAIARALSMQPEIILFDEPTSALDPELVNNIIDVIKILAIENGKTVVITTHQLNFAAEIASKIIFMDQGKVIETGTSQELLNNPQSKRLQLFLREFNR